MRAIKKKLAYYNRIWHSGIKVDIGICALWLGFAVSTLAAGNHLGLLYLAGAMMMGRTIHMGHVIAVLDDELATANAQRIMYKLVADTLVEQIEAATEKRP